MLIPKRYVLERAIPSNANHEYLLEVISEKDWERISRGELVFFSSGHLYRRRTNTEIFQELTRNCIYIFENLFDEYFLFTVMATVIVILLLLLWLANPKNIWPDAAEFMETNFKDVPIELDSCRTDRFGRQECELVQPGDEVGEYNRIKIVRSSKQEEFEIISK